MEGLPDDVLLAILQYVDNDDLLSCRVVCSRWRDLVAHPDVWINRSIGGKFLRLHPPCCNALSLDSWELNSFGFLAATTPTAALRLWLNPQTNVGAVLSASIVSHQASLGRLQKVLIYTGEDDGFFKDCEDKEDDDDDGYYYSGDYTLTSVGLSQLLGAIRRVEGLRYLYMYVDPPVRKLNLAERPGSAVPPAPSLQKLDYCGQRGGLLQALLQTYAESLREFEMYEDMALTTKVAEMLVKVKHLRTLTCSISGSGLEPLLRCRSLKSLHLYVHMDEGDDVVPHLSSAVSFLRAATKLNQVYLQCFFEGNTDLWVMGLVRALAHSGRSEITSLVVDMDSKDYLACEDIGCSVSNLRRLEKLEIRATVPPSMFSAIPPNSTLIELTVNNIRGCPSCYWPKVCNMLRLNPQLYFTVSSNLRDPKCDSCEPSAVQGFPRTVFKMSYRTVNERRV